MPKYSACPYSRCPLRCHSRAQHRARYAELKRRPKKKKEIPKLSNKINYEALIELGILPASLKVSQT